jgi:para-aminobenzoate synthetase component 1
MLTPTTPTDFFRRVANRPGAVWLDGGDAQDGWSIISWSPTRVCSDPNVWPEQLRSALVNQTKSNSAAPFHGGTIGYVGYNAGAHVCPVPRHHPTLEPDVWIGEYEGGACFRHNDQTWHLTGSKSFIDRATVVLSEASPNITHQNHKPTALRTTAREDYIAAVSRIQELIRTGDCYQINLTRPVTLTFQSTPNPVALYETLRRESAPQYGAILRIAPELSILCNSPELLLEAKGNFVKSDPIKGTRPRGATVAEDALLAKALHESPKDAAELAMIVDLIRNDLGRVAAIGSVSVEPRRVTAHANVHHSAQVVTAKLAKEKDPIDALTSLFPPGSVIGAPKVRAAHRIREFESEPRGVYCGSIGFVSHCGNVAFNVAIRTAVVSPDEIRYHVGGGIVADSVPADEWEETVDKGSALAKAFTGVTRPELVF